MHPILDRWYLTAGALPAAAALAYTVFPLASYKRLPSELAVHFGFDGEPNGWVGRWIWLFLSPLLMAGIPAFVAFATRPGAHGFPFSTIALIYWAAMGAMAGGLYEIVRSGAEGAHFRVLVVPGAAMLLSGLEILLSLLLRGWWLRP